jgi:hypothetical protein
MKPKNKESVSGIFFVTIINIDHRTSLAVKVYFKPKFLNNPAFENALSDKVLR